MAGGREAIDHAAAAAGLGQPSGTFGSLRYIPPRAAWAAVAGAAVWGVLMAVVGAYVIALLVVPIVLIILAVVRYRLTPVGGRRWLMLYEHGMVEVTRPPYAGQGQLRLVRWSDVAEATPDAERPGSYALTLAPTAGEPPVRLADLSPAATLRSSVARHLPLVPWPTGRPGGHGQPALTALGFVALALLPAMVPLVRTLTSRPAADTHAQPVVWATPSTPAGQTGSLTPLASPSVPEATSPAVDSLPLPSTTDGFSDACKSPVVYPTARPFSGPPPHLVAFPVPSFGDRAWRAAAPSEVQLIVCTTRSTDSGATVRKCTYQTIDGPYTQKLTKTTWTIRLIEARTGRIVSHSTVVGGTTACLPGLLPDYDTYPLRFSEIQETSLTDRQAYQAVGKYVLR